MSDVSEDFDQEDFETKTTARLFGNRLQRFAVHILGMPLEQRHEAFARAEQWLREIANRRSPGDERIDDFVNNAMNLLREFVERGSR
jgi:hypothetical protein